MSTATGWRKISFSWASVPHNSGQNHLKGKPGRELNHPWQVGLRRDPAKAGAGDACARTSPVNHVEGVYGVRLKAKGQAFPDAELAPQAQVLAVARRIVQLINQ